jgi:outer membrane protein OmpA-like peptidoglycan-associated protein
MFKTLVASALIVSLISAGFIPGSLGAAEVKYFPEGKAPTPIEVAKLLAGPQFKPKLKMRGVQMLGNADTQQAALLAEVTGVAPSPNPATPEDVPATEGFAVSVPFAFNSAALDPAAHEALDNIAEGIKMVQLRGTLVIEGHTDAIGGDAYNLKLSARRAATVKRYLARSHGIPAVKLKTVGKGRNEPLNAADPKAPENRRVQFRLAA